MPTTLILDPQACAGAETAVEGDAYRHLFRARRLGVGDRLRVVDGAGAARWAEVAAVDRRSGRLRLGDPAPSGEAAYRLELLVATPKKERAAWLVEKVTELGAAAVRFVASERSPRSLGAGSLDRLRRVAAAAVEQCGRSRVPEVTGVHAWEEVPGLLEGVPERWFLHLEAENAQEERATLRPGNPAGAGAVLIGPEGGWSEAEAEDLPRLGCRPVHLGERVLRVETAALVAAGMILIGAGDPRPV
ncbi:MAG TPA: RsmE family RNA methyltransferase [Thermoanaerobaculia bacterium]|nr:RsmE family RNA methyltransferase [Thermoanaerobaculia bacterium]